MGCNLRFHKCIIKMRQLVNQKKIGKIISIQSENVWNKLGELNTHNWGKSMYVGLATLSHDNSQLTTATYSNIKLDEQQ